MTSIRVVNRTRGTELGRSIRLSDTLIGRLRGFLFRGRPAAGEGLLLSPCSGVHMVGVTFPLDVIFIDDAGRVVALYPGLPPMGRTRIHGMASHALELPSGSISRTRTEVGDRLLWSPVSAIDGVLEMPVQPHSETREPWRSRKHA